MEGKKGTIVPMKRGTVVEKDLERQTDKIFKSIYFDLRS